MSKFRVLTVASGLLAVMLATTASLAGPIEDREATMKAVGKAMTALAAIAKKEQPFDADVVKTNAQTIHDKLGIAKDLFPKGSESGHETRALPEIWTDNATFEAGFGKGQEAALAMTKVTAANQFMPALAKLGGACKGCHDKFRKPE